MAVLEIIFGIAILIMSVVAHEVSHGYVAESLGDPTARLSGRLTLNPIRHLDPVGSFLIPLLTWFAGGFILGWAKPVPYNPYNLRDQRFGEAKVAAAGPAVNILIALLFGVLFRFLEGPLPLMEILSYVVLINLVLAIFNLIPLPPLDGSKILFAFFGNRGQGVRLVLERYGLVVVLLFVVFFWSFVTPLVDLFFRLITGLSI